MIRVKMTDGRFLFGVDMENVMRLMAGRPIKVDLKPMGGTDEFIIVFGPTYQDILNDLEKALGHPLPDPISEEELQRMEKEPPAGKTA